MAKPTAVDPYGDVRAVVGFYYCLGDDSIDYVVPDNGQISKVVYGTFRNGSWHPIVLPYRACERSCELHDELHRSEALPFEYAMLQQLVAEELARLQFVDKQITTLDKTIAELYSQLDRERLLEQPRT